MNIHEKINYKSHLTYNCKNKICKYVFAKNKNTEHWLEKPFSTLKQIYNAIKDTRQYYLDKNIRKNIIMDGRNGTALGAEFQKI